MQCYLCAGESFSQRPGVVRDAPELQVLECDNCGLVFLSEQSHISPDYYAKSAMHGDSPNLERWLSDSRRDDSRRATFLCESIKGQDVLDFGAGAGGFCERLLSVARSVAVVEPDELPARRFETLGITRYPTINSIPKTSRFQLITAFHVVEHLPDPARILNDLASMLANGGRIILEVPSSEDALLTLYESEAFSRFTYWSAHLFLFNQHTIELLARKAGLKVEYVRYIQRYPLSNHLHWLAREKPGGHKKWSFLDSAALDSAYESSLAAIGRTDTIIASLHL